MIIDGRKIREEKQISLIKRIGDLGKKPNLVILSVGNRVDSETYIEAKKTYGEFVGVSVGRIELPEDVSQEEVVSNLEIANRNDEVDGIICQLPLPSHLNRDAILDSIDPQKDVDALSSYYTSKVARGDVSFVPATTRGIMTILDNIGVNLENKHVVIVGRSNLVGKPTAMVCLAKNATVSICHSKTVDIKKITSSADIVISATGQKNLIKPENVSKDQIIIDVGINKDGKKVLHGDVAFDEVKDLVYAITPVPGGVGPMTVHSIFENLLDLIERKK